MKGGVALGGHIADQAIAIVIETIVGGEFVTTRQEQRT
jgi:hypothetical protein